ncbi:hypothetical protein C8J57DRAFT_1207209 [Mycena rebaudengoi]|nr:hypothetical protein C8J57DRAFT_1207209 [Mycena rebaudengoi]
MVRKRTLITLTPFVPISQGFLFTDLLATHVFPHLAAGTDLEKHRTTVQLVARTTLTQIAPVLADIVPGVLKALQRDDDELCEGSLQALEALLLQCPTEITPYLAPIVQAGSQYIKYDPVRLVVIVHVRAFDLRTDKLRRVLKLQFRPHNNGGIYWRMIGMGTAIPS